MDHHSFDSLTRALGGQGSRRKAIRTIAASLTALAGIPGAKAQAKRKGRGKNKKKRQGCKRQPCSGGMEFDVSSCQCRCPRDMRECRDHCVGRDRCCPSDPPCATDPKGCCHSPWVEVCTSQGCCAELDGMKACNDFCVDTDTSQNHCGACGVACRSDEVCISGRCRPIQCVSGGPACGDTCCDLGELCCHGVCRPAGTAPCTADGWCPFPTGHACCGSASCEQGPCCNPDVESCCDWIESDGAIETTCCPGDGSRCAKGGCCPEGMQYTGDLGCDACCPESAQTCGDCVAPVPGRG